MQDTLIEKIQFFSLTSIAITLEAIPFLLMGAIFSALFEAFVPESLVQKLIPQKKGKGIGVAVTMGFILPTCECGVVPIAKKLLQKGIPGYMVISYILAAPVINPIVLLSTYLAFRNNLWMVIGRAGLVMIVAAGVGWLLSKGKDRILKNEYYQKLAGERSPNDHSPPHIHGDACGCEHDHGDSERNKLLSIMRDVSNDFLDMGAYLILGSFAAAAFKTLLPGSVLTIFETSIFLSILAMMGLAILLSICSEADSFVAASFVNFPLVSQLSFVTIGPMVDLKLIAMYSVTFKKKILLTIIFIPTVMVLILSNILGVFVS